MPTGTTELLALARLAVGEGYLALESSPEGLAPDEIRRRLHRYGPNLIAREQQPSLARELWRRASNPLNALLATIATASFALDDARAGFVILVMVALSILMAWVQEHRSNEAAARLRALVKTSASVRRKVPLNPEAFHDVALAALVPGDVVRVSAGDMIPGDLRLIEAKDLFINQSALTGEAMPVEKFPAAYAGPSGDLFDLPNLCFMGASVVSGYGTGIIARTGPQTFFGELAGQLTGEGLPTAFDIGISRFTTLMIRCTAVMVPLVFLINGFTKHDWLEALMFAVAVAVGLTPEMLPTIVTMNLAKGALAMSRAKVIVKRLDAIQNLGAMDVLCTDKTGTLTQNHIILKRHLDLHGKESDLVLRYAWLNSHFQSGLKNLLDIAVLEHVEADRLQGLAEAYTKVDEIPFDFSRRRLSVVVAEPDNGQHILICKGAVEEIFAVCQHYVAEGESGLLDATHFTAAQAQTTALNEDGFRVVAVAYKAVPEAKLAYAVTDETDLTLLGYVAFLDPPKDSARDALAQLAHKGVTIKILTGDNEIITRKVCREVGLEVGEVLLGNQLEALSDEELALLVDHTTVFAKLTPAQKERVVRLLRGRSHVVGFLGDGINDSPALKAADVGMSVDTAVDIAKEAADIILLEKNLGVLLEGVIEGRKVFANITKYIRMGASSSFGNMFSVLGASLFLPFLPMAPIQVLTNNLLYDFSQTTIPTDHVDESELAQPRQWHIGNLFKFMLIIGPVSSLFDYATFAMMWWVFDAGTKPALFQTGWFVESLLTQTLIIHIIRTARVPFFESRASAPLLATTAVICTIGISLPYTDLGRVLGFNPLPWAYWPLLFSMLVLYAVLAHFAKMQFVRRWGL